MNLIHTVYQPEGAGLHPTILTIHGRGANAFDLLGLGPYICNGKFLMICPQGPLETPIGPNARGYAWYPMSMGGPPAVDTMLASAEKLRAFLTACLERYPIDPNRLAVLGFSQGGVMAYSLALTEPPRFKALTVLSSWLPTELQTRLEISPAIAHLPALIQHGTRDPTIEVLRARDSVERLKQLNLAPDYREYEMGHEITPRSLADLSAWLDKKIGAPA